MKSGLNKKDADGLSESWRIRPLDNVTVGVGLTEALLALLSKEQNAAKPRLH